MISMLQLVPWLSEQMNADEADAYAILEPPPGQYDKGWQADKLREYANRTLAEVDAKRRILDGYAGLTEDRHRLTDAVLHLQWTVLGHVVRMLSLPYADRDGYREEWRP